MFDNSLPRYTLHLAFGPAEVRWVIGRAWLDSDIGVQIYFYLRWKKHLRSWRLSFCYQPKWESTVMLVRDVNGRRESWSLQSPVHYEIMNS